MPSVPPTQVQRGLRGVDHTARPTWKLRETLNFYRDILGLPLVHVISARGWGPSNHPDFLHFFFDSGQGSTIAFFYYLGTQQPTSLNDRANKAPIPEDYIFDATHTAWLVESAEELMAWKQHLESQGLQVSIATTHEVIESIYVRDPNGYFIEFTRKLRSLGKADATDASLTLQAALEAEDAPAKRGENLAHIDDIWAAKAHLINPAEPTASVLRIFVPKVPEFSSLVEAARSNSQCQVINLDAHDMIESEVPVEFSRKELGLKPAVWWGLFTGGVHGTIESYDRDRVRIVPHAA
ncbi:MAG: VOC family protein [Pigmentiphaga sp.]